MKNENLKPELVSPSEAARRVGKSRQYIHRLIKSGKIDAPTDGKISLPDLLAWMAVKRRVGRPRKAK